MLRLLPVLLIATVILFSCKNDPSASGASIDSTSKAESRPAPTGRTEIGNFEYWHHIKNEGPKPLPSQAVFYSYRITQAGNVLQSNFGESPSGGILPSEEEAKKNPQALAEAMRRMAIGDSVTIIYPTKSGPDSSLVYEVVLRAIHTR